MIIIHNEKQIKAPKLKMKMGKDYFVDYAKEGTITYVFVEIKGVKMHYSMSFTNQAYVKAYDKDCKKYLERPLRKKEKANILLNNLKAKKVLK